MNGENKLCIIVCRHLKKEAEYANKSIDSPYFKIVSVCSKSEILETITNPEFSKIFIFYSPCMELPEMVENEKISLTNLKGCWELLVDPYMVRKSAAKFLLPCQLKDKGSFEKKNIVVIDTGIYRISSKVKSKYQVFHAGINYFLSRIENCILNFKNDCLSSESSVLKRKLSELSLTFDLLGNFSAIATEKQVIETIIDIYTVVFHPEEVQFFYPCDVQPDILKKLRNSSRKSLIESNCLYLLISHRKQEYGVLKLDNFMTDNYDDYRRYLAESIVKVAELSISNIRVWTNLRKTKTIIKEERDIAKKYLDIAGSIIVVLDRKGNIKLINRAGLEVLGYSQKELIGKNWFDTVLPEHYREKIRSAHFRLISGKIKKSVKYIENPVLTKNGEERIIAWRNTVIFDRFKRITGTISSGIDITERKILEEKLRALSITDELTGLYNRRGFFLLAEHEMKRAKRTGRSFYLVFIDVDGLKNINDTFGHQEGDRVLKETALILQKVFRKSDVIGRIGGDEFAVIAPEATGDDRELLLKRLSEAIDRRNKQSGQKTEISLSAGVLKYDPSVESSIDELLSQADRLMYEDKRKKMYNNQRGEI